MGLGEDEETEVEEHEEIAQEEGSLGFNLDEGLMNSVLENDAQHIDQGNIVKEMFNQSIGGFSPNMFFENMVRNYSIAKRLYGPGLIRHVTGYDDNYIDRNMHIPEFQNEMKKRIEDNLNKLRKSGLMDKGYALTEQAVEMAALVNLVQELDHLLPTGILGKKKHKKRSHYGGKEEVKNFQKDDRYRDIALKQSVKTAIRRGHQRLQMDDLKAFERESQGRIDIVFGLDCSGSMKGSKLGMSKRAGIALAYKAIEEKDKVGVVVFGNDIKEAVEPTDDFGQLLRSLTKAQASRETDMAQVFEKSVELFTNQNVSRHLILLTDALPTVGDDPQEKTMEAAANAVAHDITISIVGINLDEKGREFAEKLVTMGNGRLYMVRDVDNLDTIVLEDYYAL